VLVAPGATVLFGTTNAAGFHLDQELFVTTVKGSARILSTSRSLICTALLADAANEPPTSMTSLTIIAKTKQKAAN
jgi:hypothetical protein